MGSPLSGQPLNKIPQTGQQTSGFSWMVGPSYVPPGLASDGTRGSIIPGQPNINLYQQGPTLEKTQSREWGSTQMSQSNYLNPSWTSSNPSTALDNTLNFGLNENIFSVLKNGSTSTLAPQLSFGPGSVQNTSQSQSDNKGQTGVSSQFSPNDPIRSSENSVKSGAQGQTAGQTKPDGSNSQVILSSKSL